MWQINFYKWVKVLHWHKLQTNFYQIQVSKQDVKYPWTNISNLLDPLRKIIISKNVPATILAHNETDYENSKLELKSKPEPEQDDEFNAFVNRIIVI